MTSQIKSSQKIFTAAMIYQTKILRAFFERKTYALSVVLLKSGQFSTETHRWHFLIHNILYLLSGELPHCVQYMTATGSNNILSRNIQQLHGWCKVWTDYFQIDLFKLTTKKTSKPTLPALCEGNPLVDSPHKGPETQEAFRGHNIIILLYLVCTVITT